MPTHQIAFEVPDPEIMELPSEFMRRGGRYQIRVENGDVSIFGNRDGLLYLAEILARCALGGYVEGFHVHVPAKSDLSPPAVGPELVVFAAQRE